MDELERILRAAGAGCLLGGLRAHGIDADALASDGMRRRLASQIPKAAPQDVWGLAALARASAVAFVVRPLGGLLGG